MKIILTLGIVILAQTTIAFGAATLGKVDVQKVLLTTQEGQKVRDKLRGIFEGKRKIVKTEEDKIKKMQADFVKQRHVLSEKARAKKEREIQKLVFQLQQKSMGFEREMRGMEQKFKRPILDKIREVIKAESKKANVDFTYEMATAPILYAKKEIDLTDKIIASYNKKHPVKKKKK